ncbi:flagellar hook-associated protein FlgK [Texcoconibacillus texcoconensis]|uniref:Flagellar hook-associated protein 1 n=1 Tax=Texcoconibacillus texcoconensis TaxID=1095777 RepID=A0A840QQP4_9BACI|nr:flagellar hook-associated protein FlgK [Texcoconibacillus texcoconensis]MBB5173762.1 flagellar hook-associated protein 1 FlgK [Texcoconibacillus texcoconensis]
MTSTFHGLETARRSIATQQAALHTTGHNIANANTEGYSRQRVNMSPTDAMYAPSFNKPGGGAGQIGTGVQAGEIERVRESFLDAQYRNENTKHGYWAARHDSLEKMEDIMNEPTDDGIANTMDQFWSALQDLSVNPEDSGARSVVRQRGEAVAESFNYTVSSLEAIQSDLQSQINTNVENINSLSRQINDMNRQIASVEPHGDLPNDLYDERDQLVDELSEYVDVQVETVSSGGEAKENALGQYTIKLSDEDGRAIGGTLVDAQRQEANEIVVGYDDDHGLVDQLAIATPKALQQADDIEDLENIGAVTTFEPESFKSLGKLKADIEAHGFIDRDGDQQGDFPDMIHNLDVMVHNFVDEFNDVHSSGWSLSEIENGEHVGYDFFDYDGVEPSEDDPSGAAVNLKVSNDIQNELDHIAASADAESNYFLMDAETDNIPNDASPQVRGQYEGDDEYLYIRHENGEWQYAETGEGDPEEDDWTTVEEDDIDDGEFAIEGQNMTININGLADQLDLDDDENADWSIDLPLDETEAYAGDGSNALALANVKDTELNFDGTTGDVQSFYQGVIGDMAVDTNEAERLKNNSDSLRESVDQRRQSVSAVSLDEEMTNMMQFQHAYNAAARNMTMIDEMLDTIINRMGVVGR